MYKFLYFGVVVNDFVLMYVSLKDYCEKYKNNIVLKVKCLL